MNNSKSVPEQNVPATTTAAEDRTSASQRVVNLIWESTQSRIALFVVIVGMLVNATVIVFVVLLKSEISSNQIALISICLQFINLTVGIVIGFYFGRTNHTRTGGVGNKSQQQER